MTRPVVSVVGLGPGGAEYVTEHTLAEIARVPHRYLRTAVHPSSHLVPDAITFDEVYEQADTFDDVYAEITRRLVAAAAEHGEVLYAVPGSPLVLERTVRALRAHDGIECRLHPAMSFLDLAYARLGIDPVETRLTLVDGHEFATAAAGLTGPLLVAHTHANWVLSDIKLAVDDATGDEPVVILQRLGTDDECITHTTWAELDRTVEADHLTSIYIPALGAPVGAELVRFHQLARTLREQCPWDQEQTHASLVRYLLEETYELVDALQALDPDDPATDDHLLEELGDVLYQIEFHATIAEQEGRFTMADVARNVHDKLVRRHPHVFGDVDAADSDTVKANWDAIKAAEKGRTSVFEGVAMAQPALSYAEAVQRKAAKLGFDWPDVHGALPKIAEEAAELVAAHEHGDPGHIADELGDLLFAVVNVARHLGVEPETALRAAAHKFRTRFEGVERLAQQRGIDMKSADLATLDALWDEVKAAS
ncbi:MAG TPA: nucleoside triphosphate pyrophosphohydrolase [Acidimicrobiaceae bacterium]|nr:nucleoside triphosphate pyrophosphohydrolase [Acidimicrobiaceae bacterium]